MSHTELFSYWNVFFLLDFEAPEDIWDTKNIKTPKN